MCRNLFPAYERYLNLLRSITEKSEKALGKIETSPKRMKLGCSSDVSVATIASFKASAPSTSVSPDVGVGKPSAMVM